MDFGYEDEKKKTHCPIVDVDGVIANGNGADSRIELKTGSKDDFFNGEVFNSLSEEEKTETNEVIGSGLLAGMPTIKPVEEFVTEKKESAFGSLFETPKVDSIQEENPNSLFGSTQNAVYTDSVISSNNVQVAVSDVKDVIRSYQEKGYSVTIEELDLDREIQLIVKFNKN